MVYKFYILLTFFSLVCGYEYTTHFYKQKVDQFSYTNSDYFLQRYLKADQFWNQTNGPIFFYTGNEGDIAMFANNTGFMWEIAPKYEALLIFAEHRYYGDSLPYGNDSFNPEKVGYLTSEQALADYATLLNSLKLNFSNWSGSIIAFGGSYGGMLSAWMRMKYPHIIKGAIASSAPIFQFSNLTDCNAFAQIATNAFAENGKECVKSIRKSWKIIRDYASTSSGLNYLSSVFNLCTKLNEADTDNFINWISDSWNYLAMTNYPYPTNFLHPLPAYPIKETCKYLHNSNEPDKTLIYHIFQAASVFLNYTGTEKCFSIKAPTGRLGDYAWTYQECTEMVMPMCQNGELDMFEPAIWNFTSFSEDCEDNWKTRPDPNKALIMYGGKNISAASNIFFSNGKLDPWSAGGVLKSLSPSLIAYVIKDAAHHLDLRSSNPADPLSVIKARSLEEFWIEKWIRHP